jgi:type I restriction enzyme S subunit
MKYFKIKDIGKIVSGSTPKTEVEGFWNGNIPWVTPKEISQLDGPYLKDTERKITEEGFKSCSAAMLPKGSILFTSRAPIGLVAIADIDVCTNQGFKSIQLNKGFYPLYIFYLLRSNLKQLQNLGTGTTFLELSKARFEQFEVPIPEFPEQIKIATVLNKTEALIKQRKQRIA